jgi:hypothetical protein
MKAGNPNNSFSKPIQFDMSVFLEYRSAAAVNRA